MKTFFAALIGFFLCVLLVLVGGYFFLMSSDKTSEKLTLTAAPKVQRPAKDLVVLDDASGVVFEGNIDLPPPLKRHYGDVGTVIIGLAKRFTNSYDKSAFKLTPHGEPPIFPTKFAFSVPREQFQGWVKDAPDGMLTLTISYYYTSKVADPGQPVMVSRAWIPISAAVASASRNAPYEVGQMFFTLQQAHGWPEVDPAVTCKAGTANGKIVATKEFLQKVKPGQKYAYFFHGRTQPGAKPDAAASEVYAQGFFEPSAAGAAFTIPMDKFKKPDYFFGHVVACPPGADLDACGKKRDLTPVLPNDPDHKVFTLVPKGLVLPHCGDKEDHVFYLHWYPALSGKPKWVTGDLRGLPAEILEDQLL